MNRKLSAFILLATAGLSLSSCLSNTDDSSSTTYYHDAAITSFSLGSMDKYGRNKKNTADSIMKGAVTGSNYSFTIDQNTHEIYNPDSLPMNTRIAAVLATISAKNSSYIQLIYNGATEDSLVWYSSSDSINFDKINANKSIRVYAQDATAYADYKVKINIHTQVPDTFIWRSTAEMNAELAALTDTMKAVTLGGKVFVFGKKANDDAVKIYSSTDGASWSNVTPTVDLGKDAVSNVVSCDGAIYVLNTNTHILLKYTEAGNWTTVSPSVDTRLARLVGSSNQCLFAYTADSNGVPTGILVSKDYGVTWQEDNIAKTSSADKLPVNSLNMVSSIVRSANNVENVLLVGAANSGTRSAEWMRSIDLQETGEIDEKWRMVEYDKNSSTAILPNFSKLAVCERADSAGYVALGTNGYLYETIDGGASWSVDSVASRAIGRLDFDDSKPFAFTTVKQTSKAPDGTDYQSYIYWLINNGNVWVGRYNKDGWKRQD